MRRLLRRTGIALLALLLLAIAFVTVQIERRPPLAPYQSLTLPPATGQESVRVRFAGVSTLVFDDGETAWMTDGFFSRPGKWQTFTGKISPDTEAITRQLTRLGVTQLAAVVPLHSHYDHAMDSPVVAEHTGAMLIGSASALNIGRGLGLAENRMRLVQPGDVVVLGKFTLRFIAGRHSPTPYSDGVAMENIDASLVPPARATAWREGQVWSLWVEHASGQRILVQGQRRLRAGRALGRAGRYGAAGRGHARQERRDYRAAYWNEVVKATGASA